MVHDGAHKLPRSSPTQQSVQIDVADPPQDKRVRLPAKSVATEESNVK